MAESCKLCQPFLACLHLVCQSTDEAISNQSQKWNLSEQLLIADLGKLLERSKAEKIWVLFQALKRLENPQNLLEFSVRST